MKFRTRAIMESNPDLYVDARLDPLDFATSLQGEGKASIDAIAIELGVIPVRLAIPFLKRRRHPLFAAIGGTKVRLSPISISAAAGPIHIGGKIGAEGIGGKMDAKVKCQSKLDMEGRVAGFAGKDGSLTLRFVDEEFDLPSLKEQE